ncbi:hypothetical protein [Cellulosimicrobium protaetiae]|uniref:hypothetical protein n=1 Tax=Cellulosimicrobium protaetiae TaxID=2587808 RepID=UPI0020A336CF|nr:hypothetical protein [Cellulosimicrobium protaetiae]
MRWDALFDDLAAQLAAARSQDRSVAVADLTRAEHATISLVERLRGAPGAVTLELRDGSTVTGALRDAADEWVLVGESRRQHLVPTGAISAVLGLGRHAEPARSARAARLGLGHALRALMRDRRPVQVRTPAGTFPGWVARVGKDHVDLEVSPGVAHGSRVVPWSAVLCVSDTETGHVPR